MLNLNCLNSMPFLTRFCCGIYSEVSQARRLLRKKEYDNFYRKKCFKIYNFSKAFLIVKRYFKLHNRKCIEDIYISLKLTSPLPEYIASTSFETKSSSISTIFYTNHYKEKWKAQYSFLGIKISTIEAFSIK